MIKRTLSCLLLSVLAFTGAGCFLFGSGHDGGAAGAGTPNVATETPTATETPPEPATTPEAANPLAMVNGAAIGQADFESGYAAWRLAQGSPSDTPALRRQYLDLMISDQLMNQRAQTLGLTGDPVVQERLAAARRGALEETLLERTQGQALAVSDLEIQAEYDRHRDEYGRQPAITVRNITTYTREAAEAARRRILNGEDFGAVAGEVSVHPSRANGGVLPPFSRGTYNAEFEDQVFPLAIGEMSEVFHTDLGYHVVQKTGETPGQFTPLADVRETIRARLAEQKRQAALQALERSLRQGAQIEILRNP